MAVKECRQALHSRRLFRFPMIVGPVQWQAISGRWVCVLSDCWIRKPSQPVGLEPDSRSRRLLRECCVLDAMIGGAIGDSQVPTGR